MKISFYADKILNNYLKIYLDKFPIYLFIAFILVIPNTYLFSEDGFKLEVLDSVPALIRYIGIDCFDENNCVVISKGAGNSGLIVTKTIDGGWNWVNIYCDTMKQFDDGSYYTPEDSPADLKYFSNGIIWIITDNGRVIISNDYGKNWSKTDKLDKFSFSSFVALDSLNAILVSQANPFEQSVYNCFQTTDGCKSWNYFLPDSISQKWIVSSVHLQFNNNLLFNCGYIDYSKYDSTKRTFLFTDFNKSKWKIFEFPEIIYNPYFFDEKEAIAIGNIRKVNKTFDTALILKTYDGGNNWERKFSSNELSPLRYTDYLIFDDSLLYIFGEYFNILKSKDKGETWYYPINTNQQINPSNIICSPKMPKRDILYFTTNYYSRVIKYSKIALSVREGFNFLTSIYPNPVYQNNSFNYEFEIQNSGEILQYISDIGGRKLVELFSGYIESGTYHKIYEIPSNLSSGSYWFVTEMDGICQIQMLNVVK